MPLFDLPCEPITAADASISECSENDCTEEEEYGANRKRIESQGDAHLRASACDDLATLVIMPAGPRAPAPQGIISREGETDSLILLGNVVVQSFVIAAIIVAWR